MRKAALLLTTALSVLFLTCEPKESTVTTDTNTTTAEIANPEDFNWSPDKFADKKIVRYQIPGWEKLSLQQKKLVYFLTEAGLSGRDIMYDQNYRHNLVIRQAFDKIAKDYKGDRTTTDWNNFLTYAKNVWFSNGIHHHYSNAKLPANFSAVYLKELLTVTNTKLEGEAFEVIFNDKDVKKVNQAKDVDNVSLSAVNFYGSNVTNDDVATFYGNLESPNPEKPLSNRQLKALKDFAIENEATEMRDNAMGKWYSVD